MKAQPEDEARHVTSPEIPRSPESTTSWEEITGRGDPEQRFRLYRLCPCDVCAGRGGLMPDGRPNGTDGIFMFSAGLTRCTACRGEGRTLELVATCATPEALGVALVNLAREGEFADCPIGVLDTEGETGQKWLIKPWLASPRNASDAGKLLRRRVGKVNQ